MKLKYALYGLWLAAAAVFAAPTGTPDFSAPPFIGMAADVKPTEVKAGRMFYEKDTYNWYIYDGSAWTRYATNAIQSNQSACERNTTNPLVNGYCVVFEDWNVAVVDVSVDSTTVSAVPTRLGCISVNTVLSAHDLLIKDNTTTICTVPASAAVGTSYCGCKGSRAETSLVVDPNDAATGNVSVQWRPIQ